MRLLFALGTLLALLVGITTWKVMDPPAAVEARGVNPNTGVVLLGLKEKPNSSVRILKQPKNMGESEHIPAPPPVEPGNVSHRPTPEAPPSPPPPTKREIQYTVQEGDSLYRILRSSYGKATEALVEAIARANQLEDPSDLMVGQVLTLPEVHGFESPRQP